MTEPILLAIRVMAILLGISLTLYTIDSALRSFVLPRSDRTLITRATMGAIYVIQSKAFKKNTPFLRKDAILAMHSPISMFVLPLVWLTLITIGYAGVYWGLSGQMTVREAFILSGSSLMTLGFAFQDQLGLIVLTFSQSALSMMLIALLIGYLPTMYSAFSSREKMITRLEAMAGTPPSTVEMIARLDYTGALYDPEAMREFWAQWYDWFVELQQIHGTLFPMNFFRSPKPEHHWVTTSGTVLDCAAIISSCVAIERPYQSGLAIRSGFICLRTIADGFNLQYDSDPKPDDPISVTREEFEAVLDQLEEQGIPIHQNRDYCWDHFSGWRVNYDSVLIPLARITHAPYAPWSSEKAREWRTEDIPKQSESMLQQIRVLPTDLPNTKESRQ